MRALKTLVIVMGVFLVLAFGAVIVVIINRMAAPKPEASESLPVPPVVQAPGAGGGVASPAATDPAAADAAGAHWPSLPVPDFGDATLTIPAGARLSDFSAGGDRLVLRLILADQSQQLVVIDLNTGAPVGSLRLQTAEEAAPAPVLPLLPSLLVPPRNRQEGGR